ncbi:MAG: nucleotidyl transferase AbiEii/AbiGii toxin family protein [Mycobacteriales bacterium]
MTGGHGVPYSSPAAFRRALTDRLRALAAPHGPWPLTDLQRQFAYDRLLARLYAVDDGWIVKGATALLARHIAVRHTLDIDVFRTTRQADAERDLRVALTLDIGDWFTFRAARGGAVADGGKAVRVPVAAYLGSTRWASFHVDVVADGIHMTGTPDTVPPLTELEIPGLVRVDYLAYPIVDHIADKACAILERHGPDQRPSTRFKDLVDLPALTGYARVQAEDQRAAIFSEAEHRGLTLPTRFDVPDYDLWKPHYQAEARRAVVPVPPSLDEALLAVRPYLDPVLDGTAAGAWHPREQAWRPASRH